MELQVRLEPLAVAGEPLVIQNWICGTLSPAAPGSIIQSIYEGKRLLNRRIGSTLDFLLDYINLADDRTATPATRGKQLCSVVKKHGVIRDSWHMPIGIPPRCADWWRKAEKNDRVPFAIKVRDALDIASGVAAHWDLVRALRTGDPDEIAEAQARRGRIDITAQVSPEFGLVGISQLVSGALREANLRLDQDERGSFVMTASADRLETALLLAFCDNIAVTYRRCKTCSRWFPPRSEQVHCSRKCRTRASVYRLRAVQAVNLGMSFHEAAARYGVPPDELRQRVRAVSTKTKGRKL